MDMPSESTPYRPFAKKEQEAVIKAAVDAIKRGRFDEIPDEETFMQARRRYIRERMTSGGKFGNQSGTLERIYGELEGEWKKIQESKKKKKLEAGKLALDQPVQRPDIMDQATFDSIYGGLSSVREEEEKPLPAATNTPLIPYDELEEITEIGDARKENLTRGQRVAIKISLPNNGQDKEFILMGEVVKPSPKAGDESTIIKYINGLTEEEEKLATENGFLRSGYMKIDNKIIYTAQEGREEGIYIEKETGVHPKDRIEVKGYDGYFRAIGVGKNSSSEKPSVIIISETALRNGPRLEDEMEVPLTDVNVIKRHEPSN